MNFENLFGEATFSRLQKLLEDFNAAIEGKYPIHAEVDKDVPLLTDGGTIFYKGDGYKLTIVTSLNGIMCGEEYIHGYIYGPIISFEPEVMRGNMPNIQHLTFYTGDELQKLLRERKKSGLFD